MSCFDWNKAIDLNRTALLGVVAVLFGLLSLGEAEGTVFLSPKGRRRVLRFLIPAESALRRLIYICVRVMKIRVGESIVGKSTLPDFASFTRRAEDMERVPAFKLSDTHKPIDWSAFEFEDEAPQASPTCPKIHTMDEGPSHQAFADIEPVSCTDLLRRTQAMKAALKDLRHAARRMAKDQARREAKPLGTVFLTPFRHGGPPGRRLNGREEVDAILRECHGLAFDVERWPP
ncbi:MAG: hypothetical protein AAGG69_10870 [Pseudomonadota bacterium]